MTLKVDRTHTLSRISLPDVAHQAEAVAVTVNVDHQDGNLGYRATTMAHL